MHEHFGQKCIDRCPAGNARPGRGSNRAMRSSGFLHVVDLVARAAGDFGDAPLAQRFHEIADDAVFERVLFDRSVRVAASGIRADRARRRRADRKV